MGILHKLSDQASEGIVVIFQDWLDAVEQECAEILEREPGCTMKSLAERLGISQESAGFIVERIRQRESGNAYH